MAETIVVRLDPRALRASETYAQDWQDRLSGAVMVRRVRVEAWADQTGTLYLDTADQADYSDVVSVAVSVAVSTTCEIPWTALTKRYYRGRFANGATAQGNFRLFMERSDRPPTDQSEDVLANPVSARKTVATTGSALLSADPNRKGFLIQNVGTNPVGIKLGANPDADTIAVILPAGTALNDGKGGSWEWRVYRGAVTAIAFSADSAVLVTDGK